MYMANESDNTRDKEVGFSVALNLVFIFAIILSVMTALGLLYFIPLAVIGYTILLKRSKSLAGTWSFKLLWLSLAAYLLFFLTATGFDDGSDAYWLLIRIDDGVAQLLSILQGFFLVVYLIPLAVTWRDGKKAK